MNEIEKQIRERFQYRLDYINKSHAQRLETMPNTTANKEAEQIRYEAELQQFENFINQMIEFNDCEEVIRTADCFNDDKTLDNLIEQGYQAVMIASIDVPPKPKQKIYKLKKIKNETV